VTDEFGLVKGKIKLSHFGDSFPIKAGVLKEK